MNAVYVLWIRQLKRYARSRARITTREPDDSQIEVAVRALEEVLTIEEANA